jgi:hypothetical protein
MAMEYDGNFRVSLNSSRERSFEAKHNIDLSTVTKRRFSNFEDVEALIIAMQCFDASSSAGSPFTSLGLTSACRSRTISTRSVCLLVTVMCRGLSPEPFGHSRSPPFDSAKSTESHYPRTGAL